MDKVNAIADEVEKMREKKKPIFCTDQVKARVLACKEICVRNSLVADVLKRNFAMSFNKIRPTPFLSNNERNLALRCLYG